MLAYDTLEDGIYLVKSDGNAIFTCQGILIEDVAGSGNILIDCNFTRRDLRQLIGRVGGNVAAYFASHVHVDHVNNVHEFEALLPGAPIYCPIPEDSYLCDLYNFTDANGAKDFGVVDQMQVLIRNSLNFREVREVTGFEPGAKFAFGGMVLKTIHLPGHSPGHVAFVIEDTTGERRKVLFASDIGLDKFGPWMGFKYNSVSAIRQDIRALEALYLGDDFILTSGHGDMYFEQRPDVFESALQKIEEREGQLLAMLDAETPRGLEDLALHGLIYRPSTIERFSQFIPDARGLVLFWEGYFIINLANDLAEQGKIREIEPRVWILSGES
jgi:glyoxylase-like metal-dependent hydrolase (beta-lactamase superfamily II)